MNPTSRRPQNIKDSPASAKNSPCPPSAWPWRPSQWRRHGKAAQQAHFKAPSRYTPHFTFPAYLFGNHETQKTCRLSQQHHIARSTLKDRTRRISTQKTRRTSAGSTLAYLPICTRAYIHSALRTPLPAPISSPSTPSSP